MSDYKKYYNWKWLVRQILKAVPKRIVGFFVFVGLVCRKEDTYYIVLPNTLGDSILALSYLSEFKRQKNIRHVTAVCRPNYVQRLCEYYPDTVDHVICKEKWKLGALREFVSTYIGQYLSVLYLDRVVFVFLTCNVSMRTLWDNPSINFPVYAKAILYKISMSSKPERPQVPVIDLSSYIGKYGLKKGKTVFFNPVAKSVHCDVTRLFEAAAADLMEKGYVTVTLVANDMEQPIRGTQPILCDLEEAFSLVSYGGALIGVRSGFLDVLIYADCKVISFLDVGNGLEAFFRIEDLGVNPDCHTIIYDGNDEMALHQLLDVMDKD